MLKFIRFGQKKSRPPTGVFRPVTSQNEWTRQDRVLRIVVFIVAFITLAAVMTKRLLPTTILEYEIETEGYASETVISPVRFVSVDLTATREAEEAATTRVPRTYRVDQSLVAAQLADFNARVQYLESLKDDVHEAVRSALLASTSDQPADTVVRNAVLNFASNLIGREPIDSVINAEHLIPWLIPAQESLPKRVFAETDGERPAQVRTLQPAEQPPAPAYLAQLQRLGQESLSYVLNFGVIAPTSIYQSQSAEDEHPGIVVLRDSPIEGLPTNQAFTLDDAPRIYAIREMLAERLRNITQSESRPETAPDWSAMVNATYAIAQASIAETVVFDQVTTEGAKESARSQTASIEKIIEKNQIIQERGRPWTDQSRLDHQTLLHVLREGETERRSLLGTMAANMLLILLTIVCVARGLELFGQERDRHAISPIRRLALSLLVLCMIMVVGRLIYHIGPSFRYATPAAAGAILIAILLNARIAAMLSLLVAVLLSALFDYDWSMLVVVLAMSLGGSFAVSKVRKRGDLARAAWRATLVGLVATLAVTLATDTFFEQGIERLLLVAGGGLLCLFLAPGLLPSLERIFGITTDIQLLEYSDLNNELLSRLAIEIPATYAHSLMLGQLAEAAADAVQANGLLTRVSAYYHDIGKMRRPEYYTENQMGENIHDRLSPRLSARAIVSHVTEGAEMARENHLPQPLIDAIMEHHGTCHVSFFYKQALAQQKHGDVTEEDFRYPGPRPQSRETAILMICDAAESAVRSLKSPNEDRIRDVVDRIISTRAEDRQFDECDLTLKDLDLICEVVTKRLASSYHRRIAYPDQQIAQAEKTPGEAVVLSGGSGI